MQSSVHLNKTLHFVEAIGSRLPNDEPVLVLQQHLVVHVENRYVDSFRTI